jgi:pimeloyl-ACP methyl ester carboxylesterase
MRAGLIALLLLITCPAHATQDLIQNLPVRNSVMTTYIAQAVQPVRGVVVLMAGGSGRLDIDGNGRIRKLTGNQLIRTRIDYVAAGFMAATPDVPDDFKEGADGVRNGYRWSAEHAADIGLLIESLRFFHPKVYLVGTSRGALSVANAAARLSGAQRPDAIVITSGMLMQTDARQPSVQRMVKSDSITMPVLLVAHENDACIYTPASATPQFKALLTAAPRVDIMMLKGGQADKKGEECEAAGHHGFAGLDQDVVAAIAGWLKALN